MRRSLAPLLLAVCFVAPSARALTPGDFSLAAGLSVRLVLERSDTGRMQLDHGLANGALLLILGLEGPNVVLERLNLDGTVDHIATIQVNSATWVGEANADMFGGVWIRSFVQSPFTEQLWRIEGLPRPLTTGGCPPTPGDVAPVLRDMSTSPPTATLIGDGVIDVGDVVMLLRASVDLDRLACSP